MFWRTPSIFDKFICKLDERNLTTITSDADIFQANSHPFYSPQDVASCESGDVYFSGNGISINWSILSHVGLSLNIWWIQNFMIFGKMCLFHEKIKPFLKILLRNNQREAIERFCLGTSQCKSWTFVCSSWFTCFNGSL